VKERYTRLDLCRDVNKGLKTPQATSLSKEQAWVIKKDMPRPAKKK
jgi:hypothetical protein